MTKRPRSSLGNNGSMTSNRREFIAGVGASLAVLPALTACAKRQPAASIEGQLAEVADAMLADYPENATSLGIDTGSRAALKSRLTDRSAAGQEAIAQRVAARLDEIRGRGRGHAGRGCAHRPRRRAHGARDRGRGLCISRTATWRSSTRTGPGATPPTWSPRTPAPFSRSRACSRSSIPSRAARTPKPTSRASRPTRVNSTARPHASRQRRRRA